MEILIQMSGPPIVFKIEDDFDTNARATYRFRNRRRF